MIGEIRSKKDVIMQILEDLTEHGYSLQENLLSSLHLRALHQQIWQWYQEQQLTQGKLTNATHSEIRGDQIRWLEDNPPLAFSPYVDFLKNLQQAIHQELFISIKSIETHATVYPQNKHYDKHVDNPQSKNSRRFSSILYLNKDWTKSDGGELVLYDFQDQIINTIAPRWGTFVIFQSERFPHEVKKCYKERLSLTTWFRN